MPDDGSDAAISFAEKLLVLLDEGTFTATCKYAVLLALIDLCMERAAPDGGLFDPDAPGCERIGRVRPIHDLCRGCRLMR